MLECRGEVQAAVHNLFCAHLLRSVNRPVIARGPICMSVSQVDQNVQIRNWTRMCKSEIGPECANPQLDQNVQIHNIAFINIGHSLPRLEVTHCSMLKISWEWPSQCGGPVICWVYKSSNNNDLKWSKVVSIKQGQNNMFFFLLWPYRLKVKTELHFWLGIECVECVFSMCTFM